jgi:chromosome segregation ATPase
VVSLYQKFNSIYSNTSHSLEKSERASANAFVDRLKEKLNEYEDEIQRIKAENESYVKQLKLVYQQNDLLQAKDSLFTQEGANPQLTSREVSPNVKKSMNNSFNIPSPIPRTSNLSRVSKDALFDLEHMFQSAEYRRAMEILSQLDYEVPQEIPLEKINKWLTISNRIKDSQFLEIFQRLKSLTSIEADNIGPKGERNSLAKGFEELLDQQKLNVVDKIYWVLDEKMANMTSRKDTSKKNYETEESGYQTAYFKETREDFGLNDNQLRQKISYLKESLNASEMILRDREAEIRLLKDKLRNSDEGDRKSEGISDISGGKGRVRSNGEAKEVKNERDLYRRKYEESIKELDEYKERYNNVQEEADEYRTRYQSFERKIQLISENAEKLVRSIKKHFI